MPYRTSENTGGRNRRLTGDAAEMTVSDSIDFELDLTGITVNSGEHVKVTVDAAYQGTFSIKDFKRTFSSAAYVEISFDAGLNLDTIWLNTQGDHFTLYHDGSDWYWRDENRNLGGQVPSL